MSKLTVAEASKRGYATGLSILQAVQKEWLTVEKAADGQLIVDSADLERLFGLPSRTTAQAEPPTDLISGTENAGTEALPYAGEGQEPGDDIEREHAADATANLTTDSGLQNVNEGAAFSVENEPIASPLASEQAEPVVDRLALLAEIEQLKAQVDHERRHVAALLDVLTNRVLSLPEPMFEHPAAAASSGSDGIAGGDLVPKSASADTSDFVTDSALEDTWSGSEQALTESLEPSPELSPESVENPETDQLLDLTPTNDESSVALDDDDIALPVFAADSHSRLTPPTIPKVFSDEPVRRAPRNTGLFWRLWLLMSLVWVGMIGAFYWFISGLPTDLATIGQWIQGTLEMDSPAMMLATNSLAHAARDTFGPPAILLVAMVVLRWVYRLFRR